MLRRTRTRRRLLSVVVALLVISSVLWSSAAVLAQSSAQFSLGCWSITSAGGDQRSSATYRMRDAITPGGGQIQSPQYRINTNFYVPIDAINPVSTAGPVPPADAIYLPILWANALLLKNLCR